MILFDNIKQIITNEEFNKIRWFFKRYKGRIADLLNNFLNEKPLTKYRSFLLKHPKGQCRLKTYIDSFEDALNGNINVFIKDQENIGYIRAREGFQLNDVHEFTVAFKEALWQGILEYNSTIGKKNDLIDPNDIFSLHKLLDCSYYLLSISFIKTRDEIINRHRDQLQELQRYVAMVVSVFDEEKIWAHATQGVFDLFKLYGTFFIPGKNSEGNFRLKHAKMIGLQISLELIENIASYIMLNGNCMAIDHNNKIVEVNDIIKNDSFKLICTPMQGHNSQLTGFLVIHNQGKYFQFSRFDINLLNQFSYLTGAIASNSRMVFEIAQKKEELHNLSGRLISIQEEERKNMAADIHDILTQSLTGIGYKTLFCLELLEKNPARVERELKQLTKNINKALRQSRQIISNLRPRILDDIGVIASLNSLCKDFSGKFGFRINTSYPRSINISPEKGIALFRILQEALQNIRKHSPLVTQVDITLALSGDNRLKFEIIDNGQGFDPKKKKNSGRHFGMGLLIMRERAEDLGGTFEILSTPGNGCKIIIIIPFKDLNNEA